MGAEGNLRPPAGRVHYGWVVVFAGCLGIMASIGIGRFAFGMLLPSMAGPLGLSYSMMGYISTGNLLGYLVAVLLSGPLCKLFGPRRVIVASLVLVGLTMILIGLSSNFALVLALYTLTGVGTGASNVPIMGLVSTWFSRKLRGRAAGFMVIGSSFAIVLSGRLIPYINSIGGIEGWRMGWQALGLIVIVISIICLKLIRNKPSDLGLTPVGAGDSPPRTFDHGKSIYSERVLYHLGGIYFLFGFAYIIFTTFVVTSLVEDRGMSEAAAGGLWVLVGLMSFLSGPVFGTLSDRIGRRAGLMVVFGFQALAYMLMALGLPGGYLYISIGAYGMVAWSIPSIMAASAGDYFGAKRAPLVFGLLTFFFAIGQVVGPAVAGVLAEAQGSFSGSFMMAAVVTLVAIAVTFTLKPPKEA